MATVNFIPCSKQCTSSIKNEIAYVMQDFKVCIDREKLDCNHTINYQAHTPDADVRSSIRLVSGKDCCPETAFAEFMATKKTFRKANDVMFYHYTQSFKDGENISTKTAHEIAMKFAEDNYPDFEVVVATHVDNEHLHSHFIINSVSFKTGKNCTMARTLCRSSVPTRIKSASNMGCPRCQPIKAVSPKTPVRGSTELLSKARAGSLR